MSRPRSRHGCATAWLIWVIVANCLFALGAALGATFAPSTKTGFPPLVLWSTAFLMTLNVVFAFALLNWKKWGFFGFVATSAISFAVNVYAGIGVVPSLLALLLGVGILYGVLQIGGQRRVWAQFGPDRRRNILVEGRQRYATQCSICGTELTGRQREVGLCRYCETRAA